jgi:4-methylaminobutanoate oxidase (formaldehyde-forming)
MPTVYDALKRASIGIKDAGYRAIDSLRLEKGYRVWGLDIGPDYTPLEAGLGFAVAFKKPVDFIGKAALVKQRAEGLKKRLVTFSLEDPEAFLLGRETVYRDGVKVGWITSGNRGVTVGREIGLGWVRNEGGVGDDFLRSGRYELEIALARYPAALHLAPLYDPGNARVRG